MQETIALFGGSFNPPHDGHLTMASYIHKALHADQTWMLFSINPDKDPARYASLEHRINMSNILAKHYDAPLVMSDLEYKISQDIGRYDTYYILEEMRRRFPDKKFIWTMGADSFAKFHTWKERDDIMNQYMVAVVDRPGYTDAALQSPTAQKFSEQIIDLTKPETIKQHDHGWHFFEHPKIDVSSSDIVARLAAGERDFKGNFAEVADYIYEHGLYGTRKLPLTPQPAPPQLVAA